MSRKPSGITSQTKWLFTGKVRGKNSHKTPTLVLLKATSGYDTGRNRLF